MMTPVLWSIQVAPGKLVLQREPRLCDAREAMAFDPHEHNVFGIFEAGSVEKLARASAKAMMRKLDPGAAAPTVLINLRSGLACDAPPIVLCGGQVARLSDTDRVVIATLQIEPTFESRHALRLRSRSATPKSTVHYGMTDTATFGKSENRVMFQSEVVDPTRIRNYALVGEFFAQPRLLMSRTEVRMPMLTRLLVDAKLAASERRKRAAAAAAARAATPAAQLLASVRAANNGGENEDDASGSDDDDDGSSVPFVHELHEQEYPEWLAAVLTAGAFAVSCDLHGPLSKQLLLAQSAHVDAPFAPADEPLDALTWQRAIAGIGARAAPPARWRYLIYDTSFRSPVEPLSSPPPPPVAAHAPLQADRPAACIDDDDDDDEQAGAGAEQLLAAPQSRSTDASVPTYDADQAQACEQPDVVAVQDEESERAAPAAVAVRAYEPLRHFVHHVQLADLTIYEIETYARARLHWHVVRLSRQERAGCGDDEWVDRSAASSRVSRYPQTSGAQRTLLRMIGADAAEREEHHEAIGLGVLALVAAPQPALRDSLMYLEALAIKARACADRDDINEEVAAHLQLLDRFWDMCGPVVYSATSASTLERVMASIAADWQSGLVVVVVT
jgi:hypothetical protein